MIKEATFGVKNHSHMTSAMGGGSPKRRWSKGGCLNSVLQISTKYSKVGRGQNKFDNFCGCHIWMFPLGTSDGRMESRTGKLLMADLTN